MKITEEEISWIQANYSKLHFRRSGIREIVEGIFEFTAAYDELNREYLINPTDIENPKIIAIHDQYDLRITSPRLNAVLPMVQEVGGRIKKVADERGIPEIDLHIYPNNALCLVGALDERQVLDFKAFLDGPVLQFLYDQTYFEKFGRWPRGQYAHGILGVFENYYERRQLSNGKLLENCLAALAKSHDWISIRTLLTGNDKIKGHRSCLCGSNRGFRDYHSQALKGIWKLRDDLQKNLHKLHLMDLSN